jgi:hypothetical protein
VDDCANLFKADQADRLGSRSKGFHDRSHIHLLVVTINSFSDCNTTGYSAVAAVVRVALGK